MNKLYKTNRGLFWLVSCTLVGFLFGLFQSSLWAGVIFGTGVFLLAVIYEVLFNKENKQSK